MAGAVWRFCLRAKTCRATIEPARVLITCGAESQKKSQFSRNAIAMAKNRWNLFVGGQLLAALLMLSVEAIQAQPAPQPVAPPAAPPTVTPPNVTPPDVTGAENFQTKFLVRVSVDRPSRDYRVGEQVKITVTSEIDAFAYVFYKQADGKVFLIFPNSEQPNNKLLAKQPLQIPAPKDNFRWEVSAPFGKERLTVLASTEPLASLKDPRLRSEIFNPVGGKQLKGVELELGAEKPADWSVQHIDITTYDRAEPLAERPAKRFGVFFGVAEYLFNDEAVRASKDGRPLNLPTCKDDAEQLAIALKDMGEFDEVLVFTNDKATKQNLQDAVTRWLPSVAGPGDACFIYFSGHGGQIHIQSGGQCALRRHLIARQQLPRFDSLGQQFHNLLIARTCAACQRAQPAV